METEELQKTHKTLNQLFWISMFYYPVFIAQYYLRGYNEREPLHDYDTFTYSVETLSILVSMFCFWMALRMMNNRRMLTWFVKNSSSYISVALIRQALIHTIVILGIVTHFFLGCPTTHWLCALGIIGFLFVLPTKGRVMDELERYNQIKKEKDNENK